MFKPKTTITGRLENSSGARIRTTDLRVMSPTSYRCSTPQYWIGAILPLTGYSVKAWIFQRVQYDRNHINYRI